MDNQEEHRMPSPFPGMDPFLEDPIGWPGVHLLLLGCIHELLASAVRPKYFVQVEERVYITDPFRDAGYSKLVPDVIITQRQHRLPYTPERTAGAGVLTATPSVVIESLLDPDIHDRYLEIRDARSREVVTAIELLSPANKVARGRGRRAMLKKRDLSRRANAHWMEIDLLRAGERDPQLAGQGDYGVTLWPARDLRLYAWFIDLRDRLPTITVPLRDPEEHVLLNLQQVLDITYDRGCFADSVNYAIPVPDPPLSPADQAWVLRSLDAWRGERSSA
jgi:hypothetical protein